MQEKEIEAILQKRDAVEKELAQIGEKNFENALEVLDEVRNLVEFALELEKKGEDIVKQDIVPRMKFAQKSRQAGKSFKRIVDWINALHAQKEMQEREALLFGDVLKRLRSREPGKAKDELRKLEHIQKLGERREETRAQLAEAREQVQRELNQANKKLSEIEMLLEPEPLEQAGEFGKLEAALRQYNIWRAGMLEKMQALPLPKLLDYYLKRSEKLEELGFPKPMKREDAGEMQKLFSSDPQLAGKSAAEILELMNESEGKLNHLLSDSRKFLSLVRGERQWVSLLAKIGVSGFMALELGEQERARGIGEFDPARGKELELIAGTDFARVVELRAASEKLGRMRGMRGKIRVEEKGELEKRAEGLERVLERMGG
ncbi:Uncharacterised protein [Candidatus Gugararchaeum adminiculabundum]|nr:Uncharacterised protein [Candidatus Gugararchaeum adminiculabundum]